MQFLQISEPSAKPTRSNDNAIGIDLGTTNSVVACVIDGKAQILGEILPSVYQDIHSIKRLMGSNEKVKNLMPVEISAHILSQLKSQAENILQAEISKAVITVPAYFDDAARNATKAAARLAGLEVLRLINEPTAAALSYGLDYNAEGIYLIYDFGGGTFDVSILRMQMGVFQVLATGGDTQLGGDDIDAKIIAKLQLSSQEQLLCREAKEYLSEHDYWQHNEYKLAREELEQLARPLISKTIMICQETIKAAKINLQAIKEIILVGGSTRMPLVKTMIKNSLMTPLDNINPDTVVALGAAISADSLMHGSSNLLLDVASLSIGLEVMGGMNERIVEKNSSIPLSITKYFTTYEDGQNGMIFHIVQGEREMASDCRSLAKFELKNIPPMKAAAARIAVTFNIDADGLLTVSAREEVTGVHQMIEVKPSYGLSGIQVEEMIVASYTHAEEDIQAKQFAETKLRAINNIKNIDAAINEDKELLDNNTKQKLTQLLARLKQAIARNDLDNIKATNNELESTASPFLQARLNLQIKAALQGQSPSAIATKLKD